MNKEERIKVVRYSLNVGPSELDGLRLCEEAFLKLINYKLELIGQQKIQNLTDVHATFSVYSYYENTDITMHLSSDETDEEYNARMELKKKRSLAAKKAAKARKERAIKNAEQDKLKELEEFKRLKAKYGDMDVY